MRQTSVQQHWSGNEAAFQLLLLPESTSPLPMYCDRPEYLNPSHCRLCLQPVPPSELAGHLRDRHDISSMQAYRQHVFRRAMAAWPEAIMPQLLRCRLAAFKEELCDFNFKSCHVQCALVNRGNVNFALYTFRQRPLRSRLIGFHGMQLPGRPIVRIGTTK